MYHYHNSPTPTPTPTPTLTLNEIIKKYSNTNSITVTVNDLPVVDQDGFSDLFNKDIPLIDVRAQIEFEKGAFLRAVNLPILDTNERDLVGKSYKNFGQTNAVNVGRELIEGDPLLERVRRWIEFIKKNPQAVLYCFRGGLRSKLAQAIIYEYSNGAVTIPRIVGGQKALRRYLISKLNELVAKSNFVIIAGKTGSGKTHFLHKLTNNKSRVIDLEGLANHRGSAFGLISGEQPTQIDFENNLAQQMMKVCNGICEGSGVIYLENESRSIGKVQIPDELFKKMQNSPILLLEKTLEERANFILETYIKEKYNLHNNHKISCELLLADMLSSLSKIKQKLGGAKYQECYKLFEAAHEMLLESGNFENYLHPIVVLLRDYYDPFYDYNQQRKDSRIIFKGREEELLSFAFAFPDK
ncbi:MAG: tRNA 2-selenouridine(34) synthase MnmH [Oligoflexia bacterium]|nr:tRNA 2-selenouridine(34) synthase MnmH [Oligoflexia bacterium]